MSDLRFVSVHDPHTEASLEVCRAIVAICSCSSPARDPLLKELTVVLQRINNPLMVAEAA